MIPAGILGAYSEEVSTETSKNKRIFENDRANK